MKYIKVLQKKLGLVDDGIIGFKTLSRFAEEHNMTKEEVANFFGQVAHESGNFSVGSENLNYSAEGLKRTFRKYFTDTQAIQYARKPEKIANRVYANRMGNGDEASGDGWKHRGMGGIQLTGKNNQTTFADAICDQRIKKDPSLIESEYFFESALYFFNKNRLWKYADEVSDTKILKLSRAINIGNANSSAMPNGMEDRLKKTKKFYSILKNG